MRFFKTSFLICVALLSTFTCAAFAQRADPAIYGALPTVSEAHISPDGNAIAQIQSVDGVQSVAIYDLTGELPPVGMRIGDVKARDLSWINDKYIALLVSASFDYEHGRGNKTAEIWRRIAIDRTANTKTYLFRSRYQNRYYYGAGLIFSTLPNDADSVLFGQRYSGLSLFKVGLDKEREQLLHRGESETVDWVVNANGDPVVRIDYDAAAKERRFYVPAQTHSNWRLASQLAEGTEEDPRVNLIAPAESNTIIHAYAERDGRRALYAFDVETAQFARPEIDAGNFDIHSAVVDHIDNKVVGARYIDHMMRTKFVDHGIKDAQEKIEKALPDAAPVIESWSTDKSKFLVRVKYSDHPDQIFLYDAADKNLSMVAATYNALDGKVFAQKEPFSFLSSDGLQIPGYLTVPLAADKLSMPLIVLPHGGPFARDDQSFDWWSFFYAARGYLVYQPNFRGSTGYGRAFKEAGHGEWGRKMQSDITEGVQKLIADGVVDPERICIVGASYGGYAALAGATLTPELYNCAISVNGISNMMQLLADEGSGDGVDDYWTQRIGSRFSDLDALRAVSPLYNASRASPPILLIHAEDDTVVPIGQSRRMRNALRDEGKAHEFVVLKGEDHWLSTTAARTEMLRASIDFIDKHIGQ